MKNKIWDIFSIIASAALCLGVMTVFHACDIKEDGTWMHCHAAQNYVVYIGIALIVISFLGIITRQRVFSAVLHMIKIILSVIALLIPGTIVKMCMMATMRCYVIMKPFVLVMSILIILFSLLGMIKAVRTPK